MDPIVNCGGSKLSQENPTYTVNQRMISSLPFPAMAKVRYVSPSPSEESSSKESRLSPKEQQRSARSAKEFRLSRCYQDIKTSLSGSGGTLTTELKPATEQVGESIQQQACEEVRECENLNLFCLLENEAAIKAYDIELHKSLRQISEKLLMDDSVSELNNNVYEFCTTEVFAYFAKNKVTCKQFSKQIKVFSKTLFSQMSYPEILLKSSMLYFKALRSGIFSYFIEHRSRTEGATHLYQHLGQILEASSLVQIIPLLEATVGMGLHDEMISVLKALKAWNSKAKLKTLQEKLVKHIALVSVKAEKVPLIVERKFQLLQEAAICQSSMGQIPLRDITRSLMPDKTILFDKIIVNGKVVYELSLAAEIKTPQSLYARLFSEIDACLGIKNPVLARRKAKHFLDLAERDLAKSGQLNYGLGKNLLEALFEGDLPAIGILKLMTVTCFLPATNYLRLLFPKMFYRGFSCSSKESDSQTNRSPEGNEFDLNYKQGTSCEIEIHPDCAYTVIQKKRAEIFFSHDTIAKRPIAALELKWAVRPSALGWEAVLSIDSWEIFELSLRDKLIDIWINPEDASSCTFTPKGYTYLVRL